MCIRIEGAAKDVQVQQYANDVVAKHRGVPNVTAQHMFFERQERRQQIIQICR